MESVFLTPTLARTRIHAQELKRQLILLVCASYVVSSRHGANENEPNPTHEGGSSLLKETIWRKGCFAKRTRAKFLTQKVSQRGNLCFLACDIAQI